MTRSDKYIKIKTVETSQQFQIIIKIHWIMPEIISHHEKQIPVVAVIKLNYLCFFCCNPVDGETSLDIIDETEIFSGLFNLDDIYNIKKTIDVRLSVTGFTKKHDISIQLKLLPMNPAG